jgi:hypothetical protein
MFLTISQPPDLTTEPATWHFNIYDAALAFARAKEASWIISYQFVLLCKYCAKLLFEI